MNRVQIFALITGTCGLSCAHEPAPTQQLAGAMAAVRAAEEAGAAGVPQAALQLKLAQEELQQSQRLISKSENRAAEDKVMRARNDAELALSLTHEQAAKAKLGQVQSQLGSSGGEALAVPGVTP